MPVNSFITIENWNEQSEDNEDELFGYATATYFILPHLERISKIEDFAQMKEELSKFITERREFERFATDHLCPFRKEPK